MQLPRQCRKSPERQEEFWLTDKSPGGEV